MTIAEAKQIIAIDERTFDIEDAGFGDGTFQVCIADVFDNRQKAEEFVEALKTLARA